MTIIDTKIGACVLSINLESVIWDVEIQHISKAFIKQNVKDSKFDDFKVKWRQDISRNSPLRGTGRNKLRTYRLFKHEYRTEPYISCIRPKLQRSAYAKYRCGVAPLRIETGRYERLEVAELICAICNMDVETEEHVLLTCSRYNDLREKIFSLISNHIPEFDSLELNGKLSVILGSDNEHVIRFSAKTCLDILDRRRAFLYK